MPLKPRLRCRTRTLAQAIGLVDTCRNQLRPQAVPARRFHSAFLLRTRATALNTHRLTSVHDLPSLVRSASSKAKNDDTGSSAADEASSKSGATGGATKDGGADGKAEKQAERKPRKVVVAGMEFYGMGMLTLLTLPTRRFVWTVALRTFALWYPSAWSSDFYQGVEQAVRLVFQASAAKEFVALEGLVDRDILTRLRREAADADEQRWAEAPEQDRVWPLGILWANTHNSVSDQPMLRVDVAVLTHETYNYLEESPDQSSETESKLPLPESIPPLPRSMKLSRFQRWGFERPLAEEDSHWTIVQISAKPFYGCWPGTRKKPKDEDGG